MSQINQMQMAFAPTEDRILLRMNTVDSRAFQFWMTRRYVKLLWPVLVKMLHEDEQVLVQATEQARQEVLSFKHQEVVQKMDYSQQYEEQAQHRPLGDSPILLAQISVKTNDKKQRVLCMHPEQGQGVELAMDQTLLHSICKLLQDTVSRSEWDIQLGQSLVTSSQDDAQPDRVLN